MIKIYPSTLNGTVYAPPSKAHAQRILFASALPTVPTDVINIPDCKDIETTKNVLARFGCRFSVTEDSALRVEPFPKTNPLQKLQLDFENSATASRFAIAMAAAYGIGIEARGSAQLSKRQLFPLLSRMALRGVSIDSFSLPVVMQGRLEGGEYVFNGDEGSQFISSMIFALPLALSDSTIRFASPLADRSFIDLTVDTVSEFGIRIDAVDDGFRIPGRQIYDSPGAVTVQNDKGLAAMMVAAGCFCSRKGGNVVVCNLPKDSPQIYDRASDIFALIIQDFMEIDVDISNCPDLAPLIAAAGFFKGGRIHLHGVPQLKAKETDRLRTMADCINAFGGNAVSGDGSITVNPGSGSIKFDTPVSCKGDPGVFMSLALCCGLLDYPIILDEDESVAEKVYAGFLKDYAALGGRYEFL